jgi:hypothetical protein
MEQVSGYIATDGKFFTSAEACKEHDAGIARKDGIRSRAMAVVECFSQGIYLSRTSWEGSSLPTSLLEFIAGISEEDIEDLWNNQIIQLFLLDDRPADEREFHMALYEIPASGGTRRGNNWDYFALKIEATHRLLSFVLGKE